MRHFLSICDSAKYLWSPVPALSQGVSHRYFTTQIPSSGSYCCFQTFVQNAILRVGAFITLRKEFDVLTGDVRGCSDRTSWTRVIFARSTALELGGGSVRTAFPMCNWTIGQRFSPSHLTVTVPLIMINISEIPTRRAAL